MTRLEVLRPFVEQTVKEFLGVEELKVLDDGTIPIRAGSSAVRRAISWRLDGGGLPALAVSSPMLPWGQALPELLEKLNEMDAGLLRSLRCDS